MNRQPRALVLLLATLLSPALPAQETVFPGLETRAEVLPADARSRTLSDGRILTYDGQYIDLWDSRGALLANLGVFPGAGQPGAFELSPGEGYALVGEKTTGMLFRVPIDGSPILQLGILERNADAAFESAQSVLVSAGTGTAGGGFELWRVHVGSGEADLLASLPGGSGPIAIDSGGAVVCLPTKPGEVGTTRLHRFASEELVPFDHTVLAAKGGMLAVEVESRPVAGDWVEESSEPGFSGASYYRWNGPDLFHSPGQGTLSWTFEVFEAGEYLLRIHNLHNDNDSTAENDCWVRMDGGPWIKVFSGHDFPTWNWETVFDPEGAPASGAKYDLAPGEHTLEISGRSNNFRIDRWHLYRTGTPSAQSFAVPLSPVAAPLYAEDATLVLDGLDGAAALEIATDLDTILVAEASPLSGASRIHAIGPPFGSAPILLETGPDTAIEHLDFVGQPADFFFSFQPEGNGELVYHVRDTLTQALERRSLAPRRAELTLTGPGTGGFGAVDLALSGGWPNGTAFLVSALTGTMSPTEAPILFGGYPYVHTPLDPGSIYLLPVPLPVDAGGAFTLPFANSLGVTGVVALQMILLTDSGEVVGSSTTAVL